MNDSPTQRLLQHAEPLVAISITHLSPTTRRRLAHGALSAVAYPNDYGGFVHVGSAGNALPLEPELAMIVETARSAGVVWIKFDADAGVAKDFRTFDDEEHST